MATRAQLEGALSDIRVQAFLNVIAHAEGTGPNYNVNYGGGRFGSLAQHPHNRVCAGRYCSDAAGRYQFLGTTWNGLQRQLGLSDFGPHSQDIGAVALLSQNGALSRLLANDLAGAVRAAKGTWPSLPGGTQQTTDWPTVQAIYASTVGSGPIIPAQVEQATMPRAYADAASESSRTLNTTAVIAGVVLVALLLYLEI